MFWLSDKQWSVIEPLLPQNQTGPHRTDDRRVISGIIHVLQSGCLSSDGGSDCRHQGRRAIGTVKPECSHVHRR